METGSVWLFSNWTFKLLGPLFRTWHVSNWKHCWERLSNTLTFNIFIFYIYEMQWIICINITPFFYKQSNFDPRPENCLSFSKKLPQKIIKQLLSRFFSPLMYNHTTSSRLYYKYLQNLQRLHAKYAQSAKAAELNLRNTARKTLDRSAMLALSPKPNMFVCWPGNDNNKESIRR